MITASAQHEHNLGFNLHRQNRAAEAEPFYRKALALAPEFKEAWMNLGLAALAQKRPDEALACQRQALRLDPNSADAQNNLGMAHYTQGHIAEAENCFRAALRLAPDHANAMLNLGSARQIANDAEEAEALFRRSLALGVDPARGNSNLSLALMEQGQTEQAERVLRQALANRPDYPEARANLALALLTQGKLEEGWAAYESRWAVEAMGAAPILPQPRWTGQRLNGETVLLYAEQGFGDTLQFCRYAPMVAAAGGRVVLVVPKALRRVMATLDGVDTLLSEEDDCLPAFDYHCPLLSLPFAFDTRMDSIPGPRAYLTGDPAPWADVLAGMPGLKVGLVWAGKSRTDQPHAVAIDKRRSMRLAEMPPLLDVSGCSFVSLQLGPPARQIAGSRLRDVSERLTDWADTAGLIAGLDLVIAVDTAAAHLAGALGKQVWMLNRFDSCWRWFQQREDTPWYPSMRVFRQTSRGDWAGVIHRAAEALEAQAAG
jgi:Flp pilus assembly protein TadD